MNKAANNKEMEEIVIGQILTGGNNTFKECILHPTDFIIDQNKDIYKAMNDLFRQEINIDNVSVSIELKAKYPDIRQYLLSMKEKVDSVENFKYYARKVKLNGLSNAIFNKLADASERAFQGDIVIAKKEAEEVIKMGINEDVSVSDLFTDEDLKRISESKRWDSNKLKQLARFVPFIAGEVVYIAGKTSAGKSQLAINLALDFLQQGARVGYWSFEMGKEQLLSRLISYEYGISLFDVDIRNKSVFKKGQEILKRDYFKRFYFRADSVDVGEIGSWAEEYNLDVVFLDYIQRMRIQSFRGNRNNEIGKIAGEIKDLSRKRCFVVMSQFNRKYSEADDDEEIDMSRIRDSGEIEQTATSVVLFRRDKNDRDRFYYAVAKNQTLGMININWIPLSFTPGGIFMEDIEDEVIK